MFDCSKMKGTNLHTHARRAHKHNTVPLPGSSSRGIRQSSFVLCTKSRRWWTLQTLPEQRLECRQKSRDEESSNFG